MQSPPPPSNDTELTSQQHNTTPFTCPFSVTLRRNPRRKARASPQRAVVPFDPHKSELNDNILATSSSKLSEDLKVFLRIKPLKEKLENRVNKVEVELRKNVWPKGRKTTRERERVVKKSGVSCILVNDERSVTVSPPLGQIDGRRIKSEVYEGFRNVFAPESTQEQVYERMMGPLVEEFLMGKSGMLVAMGPSGSGKTHTVFGTGREPGMVPLALRQIFKRNGDVGSMSFRSFYITVFEISSEPGKGEKILDLLSDGAERSMYQSTIKGLQEIVISDVAQAESAIASAMLKRSTAMTNANSQSSRSQCIINIHMNTQISEGHCSDLLNSALMTIIDLAGAERSRRTGLQGKRTGESNFINNTSMVFGLCLRSLFEHQQNPRKPLQKHFQSSLLTRYLRDHLEGKKRMSLILTVKSEEEDYNDTSFVLRQASPYMQIKFTATAAAQTDLLGAKRQLQTMLRPDQVKRVKVANFAGTKAVIKGNETKAEHQLNQEGAAICTDGIKESSPRSSEDESLNLKENENNNDTCYNSTMLRRPRSSDNESLNLKENENNNDTPCHLNMLRRNSRIMQSFAKVIWNVLKEYKSKLQDAENEIHNLKENLDFEKTRRKELETEIQYLRSNCYCSKEISTDSDLVQMDTYLEFSVERSQRSEETKVEQTNNIICDTSQLAGPAQDHESSEWQNLGACLEADSDAKFATGDLIDDSRKIEILVGNNTEECSGGCDQQFSEQVTSSALSSEPIEAKEDEKNQHCAAKVINKALQRFNNLNRSESSNINNDKMQGPSSAATDQCCTMLKPSPDKHDQVQTIVGDENCSLLAGSQEKYELGIMSKKQLKQKNEKVDNRLMGNDEIQKDDTKPPAPHLSNSKPKRRLMPASTILLRDMRLLDLEDESDTRSKGNRGRKNPDTEENKKTQGNINLLRLLKSNLHR